MDVLDFGKKGRQGWKEQPPAATACTLPSSCGSTPSLCAGLRQNARTVYPGYTAPLWTSQDTPAADRQSSQAGAASPSVRPVVQPFGRPQGFYRRLASLCRPIGRRRGLTSRPGLQADGRSGAVRAQGSLKTFPQRASQATYHPRRIMAHEYPQMPINARLYPLKSPVSISIYKPCLTA